MDSNSTSLNDLLAGYHREVDQTLLELRSSEWATERVQLLEKLRGAISVHDSEVESVLSPLLDTLPGGSAVADQLRRGCEERSVLLIRFGHLTDGVAAHNVYVASGEEIELIIEDLERSFLRHENDETPLAAALLKDSLESNEPAVLAEKMTLAARRRSHKATVRHPTSAIRRTYYHYLDKFRDWSDTHHGWTR
jgi:hypothetical protein